ncbi:MAG: glycerate kinase [Candidatus Limnocylindrales bacterium]
MTESGPTAPDPTAADRRTVLIAPDSFKGTLSSVEVAEALGAGWAQARPADRIILAPLADGGEGTLAAIAAGGGWAWRTTIAPDPLGRPIAAAWLVSAADEARAGSGEARAVIELAAASGLSLLAQADRDPFAATTEGTGVILRAVLDAGIRDVVLGIGGSATTDGGAGILRALGAVVSAGLDDVDLTRLDPRLADVHLRIACDVTNPLLGERGAAATYGPQKGASPADVVALDARLARFADALERATGRHERSTPGAGAAGGTGFGLLCLRDRFASLELVPGVDLVMEATDFAASLAAADLVITGEGRIDAQTAFGKTAFGVARRARGAGVRCVAVGGSVEPDGIVALEALGATVVAVHERPITLAEAIALGSAPLVACGERLARLFRPEEPLRTPSRVVWLLRT